MERAVLARATVHLQGLTAGRLALVDPDDPYIAGLLEATYLVPVGAHPHASAVRESGGVGEPPQYADDTGT